MSPSPWVQRWSHLVPAGATVLDVACGSGRHVRWFAGRGCRVTALDRDEAAVRPLQDCAEVVVADIEQGAWPLGERRFDTVLVTHYLWRPLLPLLIERVAPGGLLIYETFAFGNQTVGRPSNPAFLLRPGELLEAVQGRLRPLGYEDGYADAPPRYLQRLAAVREIPGSTLPRYPLPG
jgi:SAM-dependent methyltransferase